MITQKRLEEYAKSRGGRIIEGPYTENGMRKVRAVCANSHEFTPNVGNLLYSKSWCSECYGNAKHSIEELREWAEELGGKCLSESYENSKTKYKWECGACSHIWEATWNNVKSYFTWCPSCNSSTRETVVRAAFRENFPGEDFSTDREVIGMELDGYSAKYSTAFEHDGEQHRVRVEHFQRGESDFEAQLARDELKNALCDELGIELIRVPDRSILPLKQIRRFVRDSLEELGYDLPPAESLKSDNEFFNEVRLSRTEKMDVYVKSAQDMLGEKNHRLLTETCPSRIWPLQVRCNNGHQYETNYDNIVRGRGCPECAHSRPKAGSEIENAVNDRNYVLLNHEHKKANGRSRLYITVKCPNDHDPSEILWDNFKKGRGCMQCGRARTGTSKRLGTVENRLNRYGLELVTEYTGNNKPTVFRCRDGHTFTSTLQKIDLAPEKACPPCVMNGYEGIALLDDYGPETDSVYTKLKWRCERCLKEFEATYRGMQARIHLCPNKRCPNQ